MEDFIKYCKQYPLKRFEKGELILVQGEVPTCAYILKKGAIKGYNLTSQGEEKPINFSTDKEIFPISWLFNKVRYAQYYYEAFSDCETYCMPARDFHVYLSKSPDFAVEMLNYLAEIFVNYEMRINALEQSKAAHKVINTIHYLCLRFGEETKKGTVEVKLPLTQQDLANFMGLTRETTGIELKKLQRKGVLTYKKQNYIVRINMLNDLLDEDYDNGRIIKGREALVKKLKTAA